MEYFEATVELQNLQTLASFFETILPEPFSHRLFFVYSHKNVLCILRTKYAKTVHMCMQLVAGLLFSLSLEACGGG